MALTWTAAAHPDARYYAIDFSEDGGATWKLYNHRRDVLNDQGQPQNWINHHGDLYCGFSFYRCLKRVQHYTYRVRVLDASGEPLTDWSEPGSATSLDWPAHVELDPPFPPGPYHSGAEVTLSASTDTYGEGLQLTWEFTTWQGATYEVLSGCTPNARSCTLRIRDGGGGELDDLGRRGSMKLARPLRAPETSVDVRLIGTDAYGLTDHSQRISLVLERPEDPCGDAPPCDP